MNTPQEHHGEPGRREGLGGRVRRFVDDELSRIRDKEHRGGGTRTDQPGDPDPVDRGGGVDHPYDSGDSRPAQETQLAHETDPGRYPVDAPATAAPHETGFHNSGREPGLPSARSEELGDQSGDQLAAEGTAARVGLLNDVAGLRDEWQRVQGTFVDDPQRAVHEASVLIDRTLAEIRANVGSEHPGETMSTEELRVSFQRYREFFQRLLSA